MYFFSTKGLLNWLNKKVDAGLLEELFKEKNFTPNESQLKAIKHDVDPYWYVNKKDNYAEILFGDKNTLADAAKKKVEYNSDDGIWV